MSGVPLALIMLLIAAIAGEDGLGFAAGSVILFCAQRSLDGRWRSPRSRRRSTYAEYAVGIASLRAMAQGQPLGETGGALSTPLPLAESGKSGRFGEPWRIFAFSDNYPLFVFIFVLILAVGLTLTLAWFAGSAVASAARVSSPATRAAYGAIVGVVWALALTLLRVLRDMRWLEATACSCSCCSPPGRRAPSEACPPCGEPARQRALSAPRYLRWPLASTV